MARWYVHHMRRQIQYNSGTAPIATAVNPPNSPSESTLHRGSAEPEHDQ